MTGLYTGTAIQLLSIMLGRDQLLAEMLLQPRIKGKLRNPLLIQWSV